MTRLSTSFFSPFTYLLTKGPWGNDSYPSAVLQFGYHCERAQEMQRPAEKYYFPLLSLLAKKRG